MTDNKKNLGSAKSVVTPGNFRLSFNAIRSRELGIKALEEASVFYPPTPMVDTVLRWRGPETRQRLAAEKLEADRSSVGESVSYKLEVEQPSIILTEQEADAGRMLGMCAQRTFFGLWEELRPLPEPKERSSGPQRSKKKVLGERGIAAQKYEAIKKSTKMGRARFISEFCDFALEVPHADRVRTILRREVEAAVAYDRDSAQPRARMTARREEARRLLDEAGVPKRVLVPQKKAPVQEAPVLRRQAASYEGITPFGGSVSKPLLPDSSGELFVAAVSAPFVLVRLMVVSTFQKLGYHYLGNLFTVTDAVNLCDIVAVRNGWAFYSVVCRIMDSEFFKALMSTLSEYAFLEAERLSLIRLAEECRDVDWDIESTGHTADTPSRIRSESTPSENSAWEVPDDWDTGSMEGIRPLGFGAVARQVRHSPIVVKTLTFFSAIMGSLAFKLPEDAAAFMNASKERLSVFTSDLDLFIGGIDLFEYWYKRCVEVEKTKDWTTFFEPDEVTRCLKAMEKSQEELMELHVEPAMVHAILGRARDAYVHSTKINNQAVAHARERLYSTIKLKEDGLANERPPPAGFIVTGPPGVGKGLLVTYVEAIQKARKGFPEGVTSTFYYQTNTNCQEKPSIVSTVVINDFFQVKDETMAQNGTSALDILQKMVDSAPVNIQAASIEAKRDSRLYCDVVLVTTNNKEFSCSTATDGAVTKLDRRYKIIHIDYHPEIVDDLGNQPFPAYVEAHGGWKARSWCTYTVGEMRNKPTGKTLDLSIKHVIKKFSNLEELASYVVLESENKRSYEAPKPTLCPDCSGASFHFPNCPTLTIVPHGSTQSIGGVFEEAGAVALHPDGALTASAEASAMRIANRVTDPEGQPMAQLETVMDRTARRFERSVTAGIVQAGNVARERTSEAVLRVGALSMGIMAVASICSIALYWYRSYKEPSKKSDEDGFEKVTPHANMVSNVNLPRDPAVRVLENRSTAAPWMGATLNRQVVPVQFGTNHTYALVLTPYTLLVNKHLLKHGSKPWTHGAADINWDDNFTLHSGAKPQHIKLDEAHVWIPQTADIAVIYCDNILKGAGTGIVDAIAPRYWSPSKGAVASYKGLPVNCELQLKFGHPAYVVTDWPGVKPTVGDCGTPLMVSGLVVGVLSGVVIATGQVVFSAVSQQDIGLAEQKFEGAGLPVEHTTAYVPYAKYMEPVVTKFGDMHPKSDGAWCVKKFGDDFLLDRDHVPVGHAIRENSPRFKISTTPFYDVCGDRLTKEYGAPYEGKKAEVVDGEYLSPAVYRFKAMAHGVSYHAPCLRQAVGLVLDSLGQPPPLTVLDWNRAIAGSEENCYMNPRDNRKAIGAVLSTFGVTKKTAYVERPDGTWDVHPEVLRLAEEYERIAFSSEPLPPVIVTAVRKEEVYPLEKTRKKKARYFYVLCHSYNLALRKYLLPIISWLVSEPMKTGFVGAINASSYQWHEMALTLEGKATFGADQKEFDQRHKLLLSRVAWVYEQLALRAGYTQAQARATRRLALMMSSSYLSMEDDWFYCSGSGPSGSADTTIRNCIITKIIVYYSILRQGASVSACTLYCLGDDNLGGLERSARVDIAHFTATGAELGYTMTSDSKDSDVDEAPLESLTFLKRGIVRTRKGIYVGPLAKESIFKALCYASGTPKSEMDMRCCATAQSMIREAYLHGPAFFAELRSIILSVYPDVLLPTFDECQDDYLHNRFYSWQTATIPTCESPLEGTAESESFTEALSNGAGWDHSEIKPLGLVANPPARWYGGQRSRNIPPAELNYNEHVDAVKEENAPVTAVNFLDKEVQSYPDGMRSLVDRDGDQDLAKVLSRPRQIFTIPANTNELSGRQLFTYWMTSNVQVSNYLDYYGLFRGDARVKITYTGSTQLIGKMIFAFVPYMGIHSSYTNRTYSPFVGGVNSYDIAAFSSCPKVEVDFSTSETHEIVLPYPLPTTFLKIDSWFDYTVYWWNVNPLVSVNGGTAEIPTIQFFVSYDNVELFRVEALSGTVPPVELDWDKVQPLAQTETTSFNLSSALAYASYIASKLPFSFATPAQKILQGSSMIAAALGFSRFTEPTETQVVARFSNNPATMSGDKNFAFMLGADPSVARPVDHGIIPMAVEGETDIQSVASRMAIIVLNWQAGNAVNANPLTVPGQVGPPVSLSLTPLAYATSAFRYWTGSIKYCVEVVACPLLRTRIGIAVIPEGKPTPVNFPADGTFLTHIVEVAGTTCYEFEVPYMYAEQFRVTTAYGLPSAPVTTETRVVYYYLTDPTGPSPTPVYPYVNLWVGAGESFSLGVPDLRLTSDYYVSTNIDAVTPFSGKAALATFGEVIPTFELLAHRRTPYGDFIEANEQSTYITFPVFPYAAQDANTGHWDATSIPHWSFLTWACVAFLGNTGGIVHQISGGTQVQGLVYVTTNYSSNAAPSPIGPRDRWDESLGGMAFDTTNNPFIEVVVPDRNQLAFRPPASQHVAFSGDFGTYCLWLRHTDALGNNNPHADWVGAADDFRLGGFICPPRLTART